VAASTEAPAPTPQASSLPASSNASSTPAAAIGGIHPGDPRLVPGKPGGTMTVALVGPCCGGVDNVVPMGAGGDFEWLHLVYEHLLTNSVDPTTVNKNPYSGKYGDLVPELADSWSVDPSHLVWTFRLHSGVTWSDGSPFTSADVKFSFEVCFDPKVLCDSAGMGHVIRGGDAVLAGKTKDLSGVQAPDPLTVTVTTLTPQPLLPYFAEDVFIVQKASLGLIPRDQIDQSRAYWGTPNDASGKGGPQGTGPFFMTAYAPGQSMTLSRNDHYWRSRPYLDRIVRREYKDTASALLAFEAGEVDLTYITADDVARESTSTIGTVLPGPSGVDLDLALNPETVPDFAKPTVHQAILSAIDRVPILTNVYHIPDPQPLNCLFLDPALNPPDVTAFPYDPAKARALLTSAGVDPAKWGSIVFDTYYGDSGTLAAMTAIQSNLADVGITVSIQQMDSASWSQRFYGKGTAPATFQMSLIGGDAGLADNGYGYGSYASANAYPGGGNGWNGYHFAIPALDTAYTAMLGQFDPAARVPLLQNICRVDAIEQPMLNLWQTTRYWLVNNRIGNFISTPGPGMGNYYKAAETWYIRS
jgi:peptide/nickel transport system substrate-binding protein